MRKELTDRVLRELKYFGNFAKALYHLSEHSVINYQNGTVTHHMIVLHHEDTRDWGMSLIYLEYF